ncbi:MAG: hypothetical protein EPO01_06785 [Aquabacterium sp.]|nr:MAG: hypothetical protein EPO01_06785 [Aquabacterium sp.]
MNVKQWLAGCALAVAAVPAAWADYTQVVVFGDSLSDDHRYYEFNENVFGTGYPKAPPALRGRFSNGPVAVEYLASNLGLPLKNYSFAGARTDYGSLLLLPVGTLSQVNEYLNNNALIPTITTFPIISTITSLLPGTGRADPKALHVIWTGPDDFYSLGGLNSTTAYTASLNIVQAVVSLYNGGARYFFIPNMPDLATTPRATARDASSPGYKANCAKFSAQFATVLAQQLKNWAWRYPNAKIITHDTYGFFARELKAAEARGIETKKACHPGGLNLSIYEEDRPVCPDPDNYLFWDDNHPTDAANKILGAEWAKAITIKP